MSLSRFRRWDGGDAPTGLDVGVAVEVAGSELVLSWRVSLLESPRVPSVPAGFLDGLWEFDVVELFLAPAAAGEGKTRYLELEVGPGGHWLALSLADVRVREAVLERLPVRVAGVVERATWRGSLRVAFEEVERIVGPLPWRGLGCAVLGGGIGDCAYLTSSRLPGPRPDFHQPHAWPLLPL